MTVVVLGGINEDIVVSVEDLPRRGETIAAKGMTRGTGGKGLNQAIAAARQGGSVRMLGAVGRDPAGAWLRETMTREGIDTAGVAVLDDHPTGQAMIALAANGDNTIIVNAGANAAFDLGSPGGAVPDGAVFLTQFEAALGAIEHLFSTPQAERGTRILNAAPALEAGRALLRLADVLVLNETELQVLGDLPSTPEEHGEIVRAARGLICRPEQDVVVTLGAKGALWVTGHDATMVAGFRMDAVDTIGAGDCFCGALAAALDAGRGMADALRRANAAAALSVTRRGAGESAPHRRDVEALLGA